MFQSLPCVTSSYLVDSCRALMCAHCPYHDLQIQRRRVSNYLQALHWCGIHPLYILILRIALWIV
jgi:hypothetical protein